MVFSDTTTKQGIIEDIDFLVDTDATSYTLLDKTRNVNRWQDKAVGLILEADGDWQFDDSNYTTLPIGTTNLVNGQQQYTFDDSFLKILRMEYLDNDGIWTTLKPIDEHQIKQGLEEFNKTNGSPRFYDKIGDAIFLYPAPATANVTLTAGLKAYFQRQSEDFVSTDTTRVPGFANIFHRLLSLGPALDYANIHKPDRTVVLQNQITVLEKNLKEFYGKRERDVKKQLRPRIINAN